MTRIALACVGILAVLTACGNGQDTSDTMSVNCQEPPAGELTAESAIEIVITPNPVAPGSEASLLITGEGLPDKAATGAGAFWQCWDGSQWVDTHHIVKELVGVAYRTRELTPGATWTIPAVGYVLPSSRPILIPNVPPGTYRVVDSVFVDGTEITGFAIVEVR